MGAYLDHAASSPLRPAARVAMEPFLDGLHGNPSGQHRHAREARRRLDDARDLIADLCGVGPAEVVLTSGGTEADDLAVAGVTAARGGTPWCSAVEHHAVLEPVARAGGSTVPVDVAGVVDLVALDRQLRSGPTTSVVSVLAVNNETGLVQPIDDIAACVRRAAPGVPFHVDAVAAAPWFDLGPIVAAADLVSLSAHKVGGPKGAGALVVRGDVALVPRLVGGGQERQRRSGTPNVAGAVGFAAALEATARERSGAGPARRDRLAAGLLAALAGARETVPPGHERSPGIVHLLIPGVEREPLLFLLDEAGLSASAGSSCASGALEPSHVLAAMGVPAADAAGALRLSLGWSSTDADVDAALEIVPAVVTQLGGAVTAGWRTIERGDEVPA